MKKIVPLVVLVLMLGVVPCSSLSGDKAAGPLKIVYCGTTLSQESGDRAKQVLTIAAAKANAAGGINGQKVVVEFIDGGTDQQSY